IQCARARSMSAAPGPSPCGRADRTGEQRRQRAEFASRGARTRWSLRAFNEGRGKRVPTRRNDAALGDKPGDEARGGHVEAVIRNGGGFRHDAHGLDAAVGGAAAHGCDFVGPALFDRHLGKPIRHREIDGWRRQAYIERHAIVLGCERLEIGADLVADVAVGGDPVRPHDHHVDHAVLHQVAAGIIRDHRVRHAVLAELPGSERGALVARTRLVDPAMERHALIVRHVDRRQGGAEIDGREPARVTMGQHLQRLTRLLVRGHCGDQFGAMAADRLVDGDVFVANLGRAAIGGGHAFLPRTVAYRGHHLVQRPFEVDGGGTRGDQRRAGALERLVGGIRAQRQRDPIGRRRPDERRAAHLHGRDRARDFRERRQADGREPMRKHRLVDDADRPAVGLDPDGAGLLALNLHGARHSRDSSKGKPRPAFPSLSPPAHRGDGTRRGGGRMPIDAEAEYNNRARVPEHPEISARWARAAEDYRAEAMKERRAELGLSYGSSLRQFIDLFSPRPGVVAPLALFIHGGYWRSLDPSLFSHMARGLNSHGAAGAGVGYDLCPEVTIAEIIDQIRHACLFLWLRTGQRMMIYGHSAGGHLAGAMVATDWQALYPKAPPDLVPAAYSISGLFDLTPLVGLAMAQDLRLDEAEARRVSPLFWPAPKERPFDAVVGALESSEFLRQSRVVADSWGKAGAQT